MFELTAVIGDLSTPVKVGWTLWFAWGVVSLGWYRHARVAAYEVPAPTPSRFISTPADETNEPHEEGPMYSEPAYNEPTELPSYSDSTGSPYNDSHGSSARNY